jgi:sirohydrochlorin cobaltochelatase
VRSDAKPAGCVTDAPQNATRAALVLFAHGSRDPDWAEPFRAIQRKVSARKPAVTVELAFLQLMEPTLSDVVGRLAGSGHTRVTIAPLFMAEGAHLKRDLAALVATLEQRHPRIEVRLLPAAGEVDGVRDAISAWIADCA